MRCILTAGPTGEPLDQVRRLTNHSTGSLGTGLANHLVSLGHEVLLLRGELCTAPPPIAAVEVIPFSSVADLSRKLLAQATVDPVRIFHAAAVSDFTFGPIFSQNADGERAEVRSGKVSTRGGRLFTELIPTPKILARLREAFPSAFVTGWKYEVDGSTADVLVRCREQLRDCRTDLCVGNGPAYGPGFGLVTAGGHVHLEDAPSLYRALANWTEKRD